MAYTYGLLHQAAALFKTRYAIIIGAPTKTKVYIFLYANSKINTVGQFFKFLLLHYCK